MAFVLQREGYSTFISMHNLSNFSYSQRLGRPEADLSPGMKGIIITTNVPEKRCVLEAYQILNEVWRTHMRKVPEGRKGEREAHVSTNNGILKSRCNN